MSLVVYEVNIDVDVDISAAYRQWLDGHVREILGLPEFLAARIFEVEDEQAAPGTRLSVQYELATRAALDQYFAQHAERLRSDGIARFGQKFRARRRILSQAAAYRASSD